MPKYTKEENLFWTMMLKYANKKGSKLLCYICGRHIRSGTKQAHDHFFGITHPDNNIYEIFSPIGIPDYMLVPDPKTGIPLPKDITYHTTKSRITFGEDKK
jgi:hypothetical protein